MRLIIFLFLSGLCTAASAVQPQPSDLQALPPPALDANETVDEPQVTITQKSDQTEEEFRIAGRLYMIKITPKDGKPYYLVDDVGDGKFSRHDGLDSGVRPPRWVIHNF